MQNVGSRTCGLPTATFRHRLCESALLFNGHSTSTFTVLLIGVTHSLPVVCVQYLYAYKEVEFTSRGITVGYIEVLCSSQYIESLKISSIFPFHILVRKDVVYKFEGWNFQPSKFIENLNLTSLGFHISASPRQGTQHTFLNPVQPNGFKAWWSLHRADDKSEGRVFKLDAAFFAAAAKSVWGYRTEF